MSGGVTDTNEEGENGQGLTSLVGAVNLIPVDTTTEDGVTKLEVKSSVVPSALGDVFFIKATNGGSGDLNVDGTTPITFSVLAESGVGAKDLIVEELRFSSFDNALKIDGFMGIGAALTIGLEISVTNNNGDVFSFLSIKSTADFDAHFSFGNGGKFQLIAAGNTNYLSATYSPNNPFILKKDTGDKVTVKVSDNISALTSLEFVSFGFKKDGA